MIFATIGTQAPFNRFVKMMDELCEGLDEEVIVQTIGLDFTPKNLKVVEFMPPHVFDDYFRKARIVVAHAGMGTIISSLVMQKPLIIVPRLASKMEHRNDHQMDTAMRLNELGLVHVAYDKKQLRDLMYQKDLKPLRQIGDRASESLVKSIMDFIGD